MILSMRERDSLQGFCDQIPKAEFVAGNPDKRGQQITHSPGMVALLWFLPGIEIPDKGISNYLWCQRKRI